MPHSSDFMDKGHPHDVIRVSNPTAQDITVEWGGVPHELKAGETQMFTRFIGEHIAKHLTDREIGPGHPDFWKPKLRKEWRDKIIVGVVTEHKASKKMTPGEQAAAEQEALRVEQERRIKALEQQVAQATSAQVPDPQAVKEAESGTDSTPVVDNSLPDSSDTSTTPMTWPEFSKLHAKKGTPREQVSTLWSQYKEENKS